MTPQNQVTIGKCVCGHSRAAHQTRKSRCGFCSCLHFHLDEVIQEVKPPVPPRFQRAKQQAQAEEDHPEPAGHPSSGSRSAKAQPHWARRTLGRFGRRESP